MTSLKKSTLILVSFLAVFGLQACEEENAFEDTGEEIDQGLENTGETLENAGEEVENEFE